MIPRAIDLLLALGQGNQRGRLAMQHLKSLQGCVELSFAAVNQENVREDLLVIVSSSKSPSDDFADRGKIIHTGHTANPIAPIIRLERQPVDERDQRSDGLVAA